MVLAAPAVQGLLRSARDVDGRCAWHAGVQRHGRRRQLDGAQPLRCGANVYRLGLGALDEAHVATAKARLASMHAIPMDNLSSAATAALLGLPRGARPRKRRQEEERREFRVVHIAKAGRRMMERLAELPRGDG